ncbi:hypothetical protein BEP19_16855 [Ammoniphilus oxalaticus]|uniref:Uncharacterized protein n=1 Tax=Ammoniphilus oxalaticus TaxID=66863 RepID=A0A419SQ34_9BACL|nr:hypothetical protein [Ammoniphilus oxalaticus]RKD26506.1 hypothetical protein BEP19_16855 [Ammoniphilus oxalaticus]
MNVFSENYTIGLIKEVGEEDVLLTVNGEDVVVPLSEKNREVVFELVEEGTFLVPYDQKNKEILMAIDEAVVYETFPEMDSEALEGATDDLPNEE